MKKNAAKKAFIIGHPISHSLSPAMHGYWLEELGIDGSYEAINCPPEYLHKTVKKLAETGYVGGNVTIPHKEKVMMICDEIDENARKIGAVNTLVFEDKKIYGYNTDIIGFMENIKPASDKNIPHKNALILGAGGAARSIILGLKNSGAKVTIVNRTLEKAEKLAKEFGAEFISWDKQKELYPQIDLLVNTTSIGMKGENNYKFDFSTLNKNAVVTDIVYTPLKTEFLKSAENAGCRIIDGMGMLIHQGVPGFEKWFDATPEPSQKLYDFLAAKLK